MQPLSKPEQLARFGVFEADLVTGELRKGGVRVKLQEQPFRVLALLLTNHGQLVPREQLRRELWSDSTFVDFDQGLATAIRKIREVLGDAAENPLFVETLPKRGYRFIAAVEWVQKEPVGEDVPRVARAPQTVSHYRILEKLGAGGMGAVYRAEDLKLERTVALKFLATHLLENQEGRERFIREAKAAAAIDHPNICTIYEIDEGEGQTFLAMAYVEGASLNQKIRARPLKLDEALDLAIQAGEGLQAAHQKGIVHRDVKTSNLMVTKDGRVQIMDFGLAQLLGRTKLTETGTSLGTPAYMSPEQARGEAVDRRTDIWSLGVVLYEMVGGQLPFKGERDAGVAHSILNEDPEPLTALRTGVPIEWDRVVSKALAKNPDERYSHVDDMLVDLRVLEKQLASKKSPSPAGRATYGPQPLPRWQRLALPASAVLVVGLAIALAVALRSPKEVRPTHPVRFSFTPGTAVSDPVISPNGRHIAYIGGQEESIWVQDLDQQNSRELAGTEGAWPAVNSGPRLFWSPDSEFIGFAARGGTRGGELKKISVARGAVTPICQLPTVGFRGASWSPDGSTIAFSCGSPASLYEVASGGGTPKLLITEDEEIGVWSPRFLPLEHGKRLLTGGGSADDPVIALHNLDTGESEKLVGADGAIYSPSGHVLGPRVGEGITRGIWAWPVSTDTLKPTGDPFLVVEGAGWPSLSASGTLVYLDEPGSAYQLVWRDRSGKKVGLIGQSQPVIAFPRLSPDGRRVAVMAEENDVLDIWLHDTERPIKTRFTFDALFDGAPIWSPAGDRITFVTWRPNDHRLFSKPADLSGEATLLPPLGRMAWPSEWSGDEKYLLIERRPDGHGDIWYRKHEDDKSGHEDFPFLQEPFDEHDPQCSPDGRFVSYSSNESGQYEIYVRRFPDGSGRKQVSLNSGRYARWSWNSKELFYVEDDWIVAVPVTTSPSLSVGSASRLFQPANSGVFGVSADGKRFVIIEPVEDAPPPTIRVVLNWAAEFQDSEE